MKKRITALLIAAAAGVSALTGCQDSATAPSSTESAQTSETYVCAFVAKDIENPYMKKVYEGFETACKELGAESIYTGPDELEPLKQIEIINQLAEQDVDVIAIAANDEDALEEALTNAISKGVKVISLDSAVNADSRQTHIQQADPEKIGRGLIQAASEIVSNDGGIAVLSTTEQATNQSLWISYMQKEIDENPERYAKTPLVKVVYGEDDPDVSAAKTAELLQDPSIDVIVAPTTVGMLAAAEVIEASGSKVKLTGLGLPSQMAAYIEDGICPWMYLWNPVDIGYLAGYTADALACGDIEGITGDEFIAGTLGDKRVTDAADGGTEVLLGELYKFDEENISDWKDIY